MSALSSLEPLRISRDRLTIFAGRRFSGGYGVVVKASLKGQGPDLSAQAVAIKKLRMSEDDDLRITVVRAKLYCQAERFQMTRHTSKAACKGDEIVGRVETPKYCAFYWLSHW